MTPLPCIYGLYDHEGNLRYVGKANNPAKRLKSHMRDANRRNTPLYAWIRKHGEPVMKILISESENWEEDEKAIIHSCRSSGINLLNVADGGSMPHQTKEQRAKNGLATIEKLKSGTTRKKEDTKESVIIVANNFLRYFGRTRGLPDVVARAEGRMRDFYNNDPKSYKCWASV